MPGRVAAGHGYKGVSVDYLSASVSICEYQSQ